MLAIPRRINNRKWTQALSSQSSFTAMLLGFRSYNVPCTTNQLETKEAFEKCRAHSPLRAAARPFTRCRYWRRLRMMSTTTPTTTTTTTTTTRDRGDRYGPMEWAQLAFSFRARQLYKNISMLFLFPVKDGKLSTGVIAIFNASCYG